MNQAMHSSDFDLAEESLEGVRVMVSQISIPLSRFRPCLRVSSDGLIAYSICSNDREDHKQDTHRQLICTEVIAALPVEHGLVIGNTAKAIK